MRSERWKKLLKIGHRGAPAHIAENTMASFKKAMEFGADGIELDVHMCKTGEAVVIHDDTVDRTTNGKGKISEMTLDDILSLDSGGGNRVPILEDVLKEIKGTVFVDVKAGWVAMKITEIIAKHGYDNVIVTSFNKNVLEAVKTINKNIKTGLNVEGGVFSVDSSDYYCVNPSIDILTPSMVNLIHKNDMKVFTWTVNDKKQLDKAIKAGVDGVMSDDISAISVEKAA